MVKSEKGMLDIKLETDVQYFNGKVVRVVRGISIYIKVFTQITENHDVY